MVDFKELEALLKEVVGGKKLSASKLSKLQEMCMKSLKYDTKVVSILYRTHKSLPKNQKISSLYVFDNLAREAKRYATKHSYPVKEIASDKPGNAGSFLFKLQGILDGLVEDMLTVEMPEATEKTRKVLEIWRKANTFPPDVLSRLLQSVDQTTGKGTTPEAASTTPPGDPPDEETTKTAALNDLPPAIRALLGNSIPQEENQPTPAPPIPPALTQLPLPATPATAGLDPAQLALLQQLTQTAQLGAALGSLSNVNIFPTLPLGVPPAPAPEASYTTAIAGPVYIPPLPQQPPSAIRSQPEGRDDPRRQAYNRDRRERPSQEGNDEGYGRRRGPGGGIGDSGGRWERPSLPEGRSRSKSPPSRVQKINSPPPRTSAIPTFTSEPTSSTSARQVHPPAPMPIPSTAAMLNTNIGGVAGANNMGGMGYITGAGGGGGFGLDSFDLTDFDMTSAASWMRLGVAFKSTYGRDGSQEELVSTFMAMKNGMPLPSFGGNTPFMNNNSAAPISPMVQNSWQGGYHHSASYIPPSQRINTWESREQDDARRGGRQVGHGSYDDGVGYAAQPGRYQQSDAVVLAGGDDS